MLIAPRMEDCASPGWPLELPTDGGDFDECTKFENGNQEERLDLIASALQKRAAEFELSKKVYGSGWERPLLPKKRKGGPMATAEEENSLFGSSLCLPELLPLMPLAVAAHPRQLSAEVVVTALLLVPHATLLLISALKAHPSLWDPAINLLAFIASQASPSLSHSGGSHAPSAPSSATVHQHPTSRAPPGVPSGGTAPGQNLVASSGAHLKTLSARRRTVNNVVTAVLTQLCQLSIENAATCRVALVHLKTLPRLILHITSTVLHDHLLFLSAFLSQSSHQWLLAEVAGPGGTEAGGAGVGVREVLFAEAREEVSQHGWSDTSHNHLRLYCALVRLAPLKPTSGEVLMWLSALSSSTSATPPAHRVPGGRMTVNLGLAFFCLVPGLRAPSLKGLLHSAVLRILGLGLGLGADSSHSVWLAIQILFKNFPQIAAVVRSVIGVHFTISTAALEELAEACGAEGGPLADLPSVFQAAAALRSPHAIRGILDAVHGAVGGSAPCEVAECLLQLAGRQGVGVDTSGAVAHCLLQADLPIHPTLVALTCAHAEATSGSARTRVPPGGAMGACGSQPLSVPSLVALLRPACQGIIFGEPVAGCHLAQAALGSYYLLCQEQEGGSNVYGVLEWRQGNGRMANLLESVPWRQLAAALEARWQEVEALIPLVPPPSLPPSLQALQGPPLRWQCGVQWYPLACSALPHHFCAGMGEHPLLETPRKPVVLPPGMGAMVGPTHLLLPGALAQLLAENWWNSHVACFVLDSWRHLGIWAAGYEETEGETREWEWEREAVVIRELVPWLQREPWERRVQERFGEWWERLSPSGRWALTPVLLDRLNASWQGSSVTQDRRATRGSGGKGVVIDGWKRVDESVTGVSPASLTQGTSESSRKPQANAKQHTGEFSPLPEPLRVLGVNRRVLRMGPLLKLLLAMVKEQLAAFRRLCQAALVVPGKGGGKQGGGLKREDLASALLLQDSAVCHQLIEACQVDHELGDGHVIGQLAEARQLLCSALAEMVVDSPLLLRLIHFQGYSADLIPLLVDRVPGMAQCIDFVPELIQHPRLDQQLSGCHLAAELAHKYPHHPHTQKLAEQVLTYVSHVLTTVSGAIEFLRAVMAAVARCGAAFPPLAPQADLILGECVRSGGPIVAGGQPRDEALFAVATAARADMAMRWRQEEGS